MKSVLERLRASDWRVTPQRRVIAEVFSGTHVHLTAEEVLERAQRRLPEVSQTTVHVTITEMVSRGFLRELVTSDRRRRYDPNLDRHQHLMCRSCGQLRDVYPRGAGHVKLNPDDTAGFQIEQFEVLFVGLCPRCAQRPSASESRSLSRADHKPTRGDHA